MKTQVFVTGGSGFIGQHVVAELTRQGFRCLLLLRDPSKLTELADSVERLGGQRELVASIAGDLGLPQLGISSTERRLVDSAGLFIHLGALFGWGLAPARVRRVNVDGAVQLAERAASQRARLVMVSGFMLENHAHLQRIGVEPLRPDASDWDRVYRRVGAYEASKIEAHIRVVATMRERAGELVVVHPAMVAGHSHSGMISASQPLAALIRNLAAGRMMALPGNAKHWLPLISVDMLARMIVAAARDDSMVGRQLLALDERTPSLAGMTKRIADEIGVPAPQHYVPKALLRMLLAMPGLESGLQMSRESLHFIQTTRFDTGETHAFAERHGIAWPDIGDVIQKTAAYVVER